MLRIVARESIHVNKSYVDFPFHGSPINSSFSPLFTMLFSRKDLIIKGKKPFHVASRVFNVSSATATSAFANGWVRGMNKTSSILRTVKNEGLRRAYSTNSSGDGSTSGQGKHIPFHRTFLQA